MKIQEATNVIEHGDQTRQQEKEDSGRVATLLGRVEGHYEVQGVEFGHVYKWYPDSVLVECGCGRRLSLTSSATRCGGCSRDHAHLVRGELAGRPLVDETLHPWRYAPEEGTGLPF